jgi:phage tail sheath protein FI
MPEYLAPGVFVEETSFRAKSIEGVSTTTTGFIGPARFGPVHLEPDILTSLADFERLYDPFGSPGSDLACGTDGAVPNHLWHAVRAFFTEGGRRLYVSRVFRRTDGTAWAPPSAAAEINPPATSGGLHGDGIARVPHGTPNALGGLRLRMRHPGAAGNLRLRLTLRAGPNVLAGMPDPTAPPAAPRTIATLKSAQHRDLVWIQDRSSSPAAPEQGRFAIAVWDDARAVWTFEAMPMGSPPVPDPDIDVTALNPDPVPGQGDVVRICTLTVTLLSRDGSRALGTWSGLPPDPEHRSAGAPDSIFARLGPEPASLADARALPVVAARDPAALATAFDLIAALWGEDPTTALVPTADEAARGLEAADKLTLGLHRDLLLEGGHDGRRPGVTEYAGAADPTLGWSLGLRQFEDIEDISMVAAPGSTWNYANARNDANGVMGLLIAHAEFMRYRVALLDAGDNLSISEVRGLRAKLDSKHAALYYPWVTVLDPVTRSERQLPPSGFVAGICARNDAERGVWKAPANEVVRLAVGFEQMLNRGQQEVLNPEGINCFRSFEGRGMRLWGARTISSDPEWKYLNVRRYFAYLERSIDKGTQWAVFEPNGDALWANVRRTIEDFLLNEWQSGALLGDKPEKAFFVRCDRSTMTQNDLDNGRLICLVGVAPLKPAEFVIFRIGQWTSDRRA